VAGTGGEPQIWLLLPETADDRLGLDAAVEVLGEADLVYSPGSGCFYVGLDVAVGVDARRWSLIGGLVGMEMEVVIGQVPGD